MSCECKPTVSMWKKGDKISNKTMPGLFIVLADSTEGTVDVVRFSDGQKLILTPGWCTRAHGSISVNETRTETTSY